MPTFRPYRSGDWDTFLALDLETGLAGLKDATQAQRDRYCARWPDFLKTRYQWGDAGPATDASCLLICEDAAGAYAGHLWLTEQTDFFTEEQVLFITTIAVMASHRKQGFGRLLMERAIEEARQRGIARVGLGVDAANASAVSLYAGLGFETRRLSMGLQL